MSVITPPSCCRQARLYGIQLASDPEKAESRLIVAVPDGEIRKGVTVSGQTVALDFSSDNGLYFFRLQNDAVAILRDLYVSLQARNPRKQNPDIINHLNQAIYTADRAAVERHGYSDSEVERNLPVPY